MGGVQAGQQSPAPAAPVPPDPVAAGDAPARGGQLGQDAQPDVVRVQVELPGGDLAAAGRVLTTVLGRANDLLAEA